MLVVCAKEVDRKAKLIKRRIKELEKRLVELDKQKRPRRKCDESSVHIKLSRTNWLG
jgi:predicted transcriptional regulator